MVEEKPITKRDLVDVLGTFTDDVLLPAMDRLVDKKFDEKFDEKFNENFENKIKPEIRRSEQKIMDYTDRKVGEIKGELILPIKKENEKIDEVKDILKEKKVFDEKDVERVEGVKVFR